MFKKIDVPKLMESPRLKAWNATQYINYLDKNSKVLPDDWYDLSIATMGRWTRHPVQDYYYTPKKPIPQIFALCIGDAVHNLRGSLDHLASAIVRTHDPNGDPYFPVSLTRESLLTKQRMKKRLKDLETALPGSRDLILNRIRSENSLDDYLWGFGQISNDDKHNLIVPTVTFARISGINMTMDGDRIENFSVGADASFPFSLARSEGGEIVVDGSPSVSVNVSFGDDTPFSGMDVIKTLSKVQSLIVRVLDEFEQLMRTHGA